MAMDPEKRKDLIKTLLIAGFFILLGIVFLNQLIPDPMAPPPPE